MVNKVQLQGSVSKSETPIDQSRGSERSLFQEFLSYLDRSDEAGSVA